jgi:hypothetical protein
MVIHLIKEAGRPKDEPFRFLARCGYEEMPASGVRLPERFTGWGSLVTCQTSADPRGCLRARRPGHP